MLKIVTTPRRCPRLSRGEATALSQHRLFYQNKQMELYAARKTNPLTLRQLIFFGRSMNQERLIKSANYVRMELPVRIAHRLRDMQKLPFIVVTQEDIARVYELYWTAFEKFRHYPPIVTMEDNAAFCQFLTNILQEHSSVIPGLTLGLSLASPSLTPDVLDSFLRRMLISRISRRVLAEHHIALSEIYGKKTIPSQSEPHVGIIFTGLNVKRCIDKCAGLLRERGDGWPQVIVDGHLDTTFAYIKEHLEYIIFELLKNAMWATTLRHRGMSSLPPIRTTIVAGTNEVAIRISDQGGGLSHTSVKTTSDLFSFSHIRNAARLDDSRIGALRTVSSSPHGLRATVDEQVVRWQLNQSNGFSGQGADVDGPGMEADIDPHPKIGIGLPMSNIFATYFGGSLELFTLDGWGTDVYLRLPKLGTNLEGIEV